MKTAITLLLIGSAYLYVSNEDYKDQVAIAQERNCIATITGERAISERRRDGSVTCVRYVNTETGMAGSLASIDLWSR